jgi:hypothetical protein
LISTLDTSWTSVQSTMGLFVTDISSQTKPRKQMTVTPYIALPIRKALSFLPRNDMISTEYTNLLHARGEDIGEPCSPLGAMLHSYIDHLTNPAPFLKVTRAHLQLLLRNGADIHASGTLGHAREFPWMIHNTFEMDIDNLKVPEIAWANRIPNGSELPMVDAVRLLLDLGGDDNKKDQDGLVPSVAHMKRACHDYDSFAKARYYYREGPLGPGQKATTWQDLCVEVGQARQAEEERECEKPEAKEAERTTIPVCRAQ